MAKKEKDKNSEAEKLKAGDVVTTDQGESFEFDEEQASSLNEQMQDSEDAADKPKGESDAPAPKKTGSVKKVSNGTFRFNNKFKK